MHNEALWRKREKLNLIGSEVTISPDERSNFVCLFYIIFIIVIIVMVMVIVIVIVVITIIVIIMIIVITIIILLLQSYFRRFLGGRREREGRRERGGEGRGGEGRPLHLFFQTVE